MSKKQTWSQKTGLIIGSKAYISGLINYKNKKYAVRDLECIISEIRSNSCLCKINNLKDFGEIEVSVLKKYIFSNPKNCEIISEEKTEINEDIIKLEENILKETKISEEDVLEKFQRKHIIELTELTFLLPTNIGTFFPTYETRLTVKINFKSILELKDIINQDTDDIIMYIYLDDKTKEVTDYDFLKTTSDYKKLRYNIKINNEEVIKDYANRVMTSYREYEREMLGCMRKLKPKEPRCMEKLMNFLRKNKN